MSKDISRFTTPEERANIKAINLDPNDVEQFMSMMRSGLLEAATVNDGAVQDNFALKADVSVRLHRPVSDGQGGVTEFESVVHKSTSLRASKEYIDPSKAPKVD